MSRAKLTKEIKAKNDLLNQIRKQSDAIQNALSFPVESWQRRIANNQFLRNEQRTSELLDEIKELENLLKLSDTEINNHYTRLDKIKEIQLATFKKRKFVVSDDDEDFDPFSCNKKQLIDYFNEINQLNSTKDETDVAVVIYRLKEEFSISVT